MWPNWTPPNDIEIDGSRHLAPPSGIPGPGPDTDLALNVDGYPPGWDPLLLVPDFRLKGDNTPVPAKGVVGIGPQPGTAENVFTNLGTQILPGWQRYLEMGGQRQVGILPRTVPVQISELWDADFVLNPAVEVV